MFETLSGTGTKGMTSHNSETADNSDGCNEEITTGEWEDSTTKQEEQWRELGQQAVRAGERRHSRSAEELEHKGDGAIVEEEWMGMFSGRHQRMKA
jgi:uncharacterized protein YeaC (DUF1315 family)